MFFSIFVGIFCLISIFSLTPYFYNLVSSISLTTENYSNSMHDIKTNKVLKKNEFRNIYFIIMDEMISLENANNLKITTKKNLNNINFKYIPRSFSSYDGTHKTLASIFHIDYFKPLENNNLAAYYPANLTSKNIKLPLSKITEQLNVDIIFTGNKNIPCRYSKFQNITCTSNIFFSNLVSLKNILLQFYLFDRIPHLMRIIYFLESFQSDINIFANEGGQRNLNYFIDFIKKDKTFLKNFGNIYFIHQMSPHSPMTVNSKCDYVDYKIYSDDYYEESYKGYKNSYLCVLSEIENFANFIKKKDSDALIAIMGDHGTYIASKSELIKDKVFYRANVFNAIKAPEECFNKFGLPRTSVNVTRFLLNCAYGLDLIYKDIVHIKGSGKEEKKYYFE